MIDYMCFHAAQLNYIVSSDCLFRKYYFLTEFLNRDDIIYIYILNIYVVQSPNQSLAALYLKLSFA